MRRFFEVLEKTDCTKCRYSRLIPLSSQLTCTHPLGQLQSNLGAPTHGQRYWPVSFDPVSTSCPCHGFRQMKTAA